MLNLKQFEAYLWVATLGSFRRTAERLHTSQPAISARIATLESALGVRLFERDRSTVSLTSKGQELLPYAEKLLRLVGNIQEKAGASSSLSGVIRLGVSETLVHAWVPSFLGLLDESCPNVDVEIVVDVTAVLQVELTARSLDLAFLNGPVADPGIDSVALPPFPMVWAASPSIDLSTTGKVSLGELANYRLLTPARNTRPFIEVSKAFGAVGDWPARIVPSSSLAACIQMTLSGIGIGVLPRQVIEPQINSGALVEISCDWQPSNLDFTASFPSGPFNPITEVAVDLATRAACDYAKPASL